MLCFLIFAETDLQSVGCIVYLETAVRWVADSLADVINLSRYKPNHSVL